MTQPQTNSSDDVPLPITSADVLTRLQGKKEAIWARRPVLGEIMQKHGGKTLYDYARDFVDVNKSPRLDGRKEELIGVAERLIEKRINKEVAEGVARQLRKLPLVSTIDHHGPVDHPFFVNPNIIASLPSIELRDPDIRYLPVFSFASVSVNNASAYPRGILFHGGMNGSGNLIRLPFLPDRHKMGVVYGTRAFTREDLDKAENELMKKERGGEIAPGRGDKIRAIIETYFARPEILAEPDLASQITTINYYLWPNLFKASTSVKMADLVYLDIETLVRELLYEYHLDNTDSLIHHFLFDDAWRPKIMEQFEGIPGGFSLKKDWGTYLFWAMDDKQHRVQLLYRDGQLVSPGGTIVVPCTPAGIRKALEDKIIFPSMLLCYLMVSLYYGMKCLGGFCQVHDLTTLKNAWIAFLHDVGYGEEADAVVPVQTREFGGDGVRLSYLTTVKGDLVPATGIDMMVEDIETSVDHFIDLTKKMKLGEMMDPAIPEMYTVLYPIDERVAEFTEVTPEMIMRATGLHEKLGGK